MTHKTLLEVAVPTPLTRPFNYQCPRDIALPVVGARVVVPFGSRELTGIVTALVDEIDESINVDKLKPIAKVLDNQPLQPPSFHKLLTWASNYYHYSLGEIYNQSWPALLRKGELATLQTVMHWCITDLGKETSVEDLKRAKKQQALLAHMQDNHHQFAQQLKDQDFSTATIKACADKQYIEQRPVPQPTPCDWNESHINEQDKLVLNPEQAIAVAAINNSPHYKTSLLLGITGSGKTEVYLQAIEQVISKGHQALVMVPEIGLTPQTLQRFQSRFNVPIVFLHSGLNDKERLEGWLKAKMGLAAIVIGTRSAIFTPLLKPGMIIVDEEHDASFKQQDTFRYNARDLAVVRANIENIPLVMGSATPSFETLHNAQSGKYQQLTLSKRAGNASKASHQLIDIKGLQLQNGMSPQLLELMTHHLNQGNQVMIFLNRRGYAPALLCHECGWLGNCQRCDANYTVHQRYQYVQCHHCGDQHAIPYQCPGCGSTQLATAGVGTEQLEHAINELFPDFKSVRIDRDSTRRKGSLDDSLTGIANNDYQILIGTQMLAKGHHFPDVTLVAVLDVDSALFSGDFRASEKLAQLYLQVSGRAGRASKPGQVVLQTHHPEHALLQLLNNKGYMAFSEVAMKERLVAQLPPYWHMALLRIESHDGDCITAFNQTIQEVCHPLLQQLGSKEHPLRQIGPMPSPMERRAGRYRWQVIFESSTRSRLHSFIDALQQELTRHKSAKKVRWSIDVDPIDMV